MMIKQLKSFTIKMVAGANVATVILMILVGFSDRINPVTHPSLSCMGLFFPIFLFINLGFLFFWLMFKRRMILIPVIGYALVFVPLRIYMPINVPADMPDGVIKVLSYNVKGFNGAPRYEGTFDMIRDYIKQSDADIVCLQEDMGGWTNGKSRLDSIYKYCDNTYVGTANNNAVGIYTRFPILRKERINYPSEGNGSVAYYLKVNRDTVIVINNHLESTHLSPEERRKYKDILKGEMEQDTARAESKKLLYRLAESAKIRGPQADSVHHYIATHSQYPIILCGDFNDNPISYSHRVISKELTDCYISTGRGIGLSYNQKGFFVRIDNIMCSERFKPYNCKVDNKIDASDHYPIYCWLKMKPKL